MQTGKAQQKLRVRAKLSKELQVAVFRRSSWLCRWCGRPVIFAPAMKYLQQEAMKAGFKDLAYWRPAYHRQGAPLLDELAGVIDHFTPFSTGGPCKEENLVSACNRCNMCKNATDPATWGENTRSDQLRGNMASPRIGMDCRACFSGLRSVPQHYLLNQKKNG